MRLTLRALLAYLDDVLEPAQAKEIGTRISESPPAAATVARIREVVRRRRIAAPELAGSGSAPDPNIVAEYLDNTLAPDAVPALEKLCLDSDMHLAEVAASHQILTAVLGEPIEVPQSTRERMYALMNHAPPVAEPVVVTPNQSSEQGVAGGPARALATHTAPAPHRPPVSPDYLKSSVGRNILIGIGAVALLGGWLAWVMRDHGLLPSKPVDEGQIAAKAEASDSSESSAAPDEATSPQPSEESAIVKDDTAKAAIAEEPAPALAKNDLAPPVVPDPALEQPKPVVPMPPMPMAAAPAEVAAPAVAAAGAAPPAPDVPAIEFPAALYSNGDGILIAHDLQNGQWNVMHRRALLHAGDEVASPAPFHGDVSIGNSQLELTLHSGTRVQLQAGLPQQLMSLAIDRGRISFRRPEGENQAPVTVGLKVRGQSAVLTLLDPGTVCGVEVMQRPPQGKRPDGLLAWPDGGLHVVSGAVSVSWLGGEPLTVGADVGWAAWPVPQSAMKVGPIRAIPHWLSPEGIPLTAADKKLHQLFEKEFAVDQPVSMSIPALVLDRREGISEFATETLALVDDIPPLVKALKSEHDKTRLAAIRGLRSWLPTDPNNNAILEMEVARIFPDEDVADIVDLLWGYSLSDARDETVSRRLLKWMDHSELAIRELAHYHVAMLTGRPYAHGYRPTLPDAARNAALMGWQAQIERNGGKLLK